MFQLVMQEAWSEVMSEVMCRRPEWWLINLWFIILHLFASLVSPFLRRLTLCSATGFSS